MLSTEGGTYYIKSNGRRDPDQSYWPLYNHVVTVEENNTYTFRSSDMALLGILVKNGSTSVYSGTSEGCTNTPNIAWNNVALTAVNASNSVISSSNYMGCRSTFALNTGFYNLTLSARPASTSPYTSLKYRGFFEEYERCELTFFVHNNTIITNCSGPTSFIFYSPQDSAISMVPGEKLDYAINLFNRNYKNGNFTVFVEGIPGAWYTLDKQSLELSNDEIANITLFLHPPAGCGIIGSYDFNVSGVRDTGEKQVWGMNLALIDNPIISDLQPLNETLQRTGLTISWKTDVNSTTKAFLRRKGNLVYTQYIGEKGKSHSMAPGGLIGNTTYQFYVRSETLCGAAQSEVREFFYDNRTTYLLFYESFDNMSSILNNSGVLSGAETFVEGVQNNAFNFSGSKSVYYPMAGNINVTNGTIEFWVKPPAGNGYGLWDIQNLHNPNSWGVYKNVNYLIMEVKNVNNGYSQAWSPKTFLFDNQWHFVAVVWERVGTVTYFKACLDGQCKAGYDGATGSSYPNENGIFYIGWSGWYGYSESIIDEFKIFKGARTNDEIRQDYNGAISREKKNCTMYKPESKGPVKINCSGLFVDDKPFLIKGLGYQPIPIGMTAQSIADKQKMYNDVRIRERDFPLLRAMGANTIRTWSEVLNTSFMDDLYNEGVNPIYVLMGFWINCGEDYGSAAIRQKYIDSFTQYVNKYKGYPAVLAWMLGNENNLAYCSSDLADFYSLANELARIAYSIEGENYHPVAIVNGDLGDIGDTFYGGDDKSLNYTDFWGLNAYRGKSFGSLFEDYTYLSGKPMAITEYGTDALNNSNYQEMQETQADWNIALWKEIEDNTLGGTIMAYSDEWWKGDVFGACGNKLTHDYSCGHGDFPTPDGWSNEEWFGVMRTVKNPDPLGADLMEPRKLYYAFQQEWEESASFNLNIRPGWNLISTPVIPANTSIEYLFGGMPIFAFNGSWFVPDTIDNSGYWVKSSNFTILPIQGYLALLKSLNNGWNLVGYPYLTEKSVTDLYGNVSIYAYNGSWSSYNPDRPFNSLEILKPGLGYWVKGK